MDGLVYHDPSVLPAVAAMTIEELIERLRSWHGPQDEEVAHGAADRLLLEYINDPRVTEAFEAIEKWYA